MQRPNSMASGASPGPSETNHATRDVTGHCRVAVEGTYGDAEVRAPSEDA